MTKKDHIQYWVKTSENDWKRVRLLIKGKDYVFALFCLHLSVEKLAKALWVSENKANIPPKVHNIITLLKQTTFVFDDENVQFLDQLNSFQLEGRYPDYYGKLRKAVTLVRVKEIVEKTKVIKKCILEKLD